MDGHTHTHTHTHTQTATVINIHHYYNNSFYLCKYISIYNDNDLYNYIQCDVIYLFTGTNFSGFRKLWILAGINFSNFSMTCSINSKMCKF